MLILSRKKQESVVVGGESGVENWLKVTVLEIAGGRVKLGFEADDDVPVHCLEIWERSCATDFRLYSTQKLFPLDLGLSVS